MSVDQLQMQVIDVVYNNSTWLPETAPGPGNDVNDAIQDLIGAMDNITGLTYTGARVASTDTSAIDNMQWEGQTPVYGGAKYLTGANATTLRNNFITQLATITSLNTYDDAVVHSYRNDLQASDGYSFATGNANEGLECFISGCSFQSVKYVEPTNIDTLLSRVNDALDTISGLEFAGIVASCTKGANDNLFIGIDDATYNGNKYLPLTSATTLRNAIISALQSVSELDTTGIDVEVRVSDNDEQSSD